MGNSNKVIKNASWIIVCRVIQSLLTLIITMLTARYLGPSNYGLINYASSIVAFVVPIMQLGLGNVLVQEMVNSPENEGEINGTALIMSFFSAILCMIGVVLFDLVVNTGEKVTIIVCALYSILLFFQGLELIKYWYQAHYLSKYSSITSLIAYFIVSTYKAVILIAGKNVYWFAISNALDYCIIVCVLLILYRKLGGKKLSFSLDRAKKLFAKSRYYIVANMMVAIFGHTDRIMIKLMMDDASTGLYSAAAGCAAMANFVYTAIVDSARPAIFEALKVSREKFEKRLAQLYSVIIYLSLIESIVVVVASGLIIKILYGKDYIDAVPALRIAIWYTTFSFIGTIRNIWILAEGKQKWLWVINLSGALANVLFNFLTIPYLGIMGAAWASLITQFFANVIISYLIKDTRGNTYIMLRGLNPRLLVDILHRKARK